MQDWIAMGFAVTLAGSACAADLPDHLASFDVPKSRAILMMRTYAACLKAITESAAPYGAETIQTALLGPVERSTLTTRKAPLHVRITYATEHGREIRELSVKCRVGRNKVISLIDKEAKQR